VHQTAQPAAADLERRVRPQQRARLLARDLAREFGENRQQGQAALQRQRHALPVDAHRGVTVQQEFDRRHAAQRSTALAAGLLAVASLARRRRADAGDE